MYIHLWTSSIVIMSFGVSVYQKVEATLWCINKQMAICLKELKITAFLLWSLSVSIGGSQGKLFIVICQDACWWILTCAPKQLQKNKRAWWIDTSYQSFILTLATHVIFLYVLNSQMRLYGSYLILWFQGNAILPCEQKWSKTWKYLMDIFKK